MRGGMLPRLRCPNRSSTHFKGISRWCFWSLVCASTCSPPCPLRGPRSARERPRRQWRGCNLPTNTETRPWKHSRPFSFGGFPLWPATMRTSPCPSKTRIPETPPPLRWLTSTAAVVTVALAWLLLPVQVPTRRKAVMPTKPWWRVQWLTARATTARTRTARKEGGGRWCLRCSRDRRWCRKRKTRSDSRCWTSRSDSGWAAPCRDSSAEL
mmetsp:Transcript_63164/g.126780  ORF Transcript_63164/g.126780 Transcript_63164/m.126780 type:complete len:211 (-) Transcript_63164:266-898(-)